MEEKKNSDLSLLPTNEEADNTKQQLWLQSQACWTLLARLGFQLRREIEPNDGEQRFASNGSGSQLQCSVVTSTELF